MDNHRDIVELSSEVIDQIAAGEVVERPSHMIKELVENSIDAGASEVTVSVDEGGKHVRVEDDGVGISADQLKLALSRHATSKIRQADDLWALNSFGFRGEALASVASVSQMELTSRHSDSEKTYRLLSEFGRLSEVEEVGGKKGTQISVSRLFENVPARLKFLKTDSGEVGQIKMTLKALALSHPDVGIRFKSKGKLVLMFPKGQSKLERARQVLDVKSLFEVTGEHESYSAHIACSPPNEVFGNSRNIWLFAQGRWIQDRSLQAAVMEAYRGLLMHGEFPYAVVWLTCAPEDIDVNIHPTKSQVKFREQRTAFRAVQRTLRSGLEGAPWVEKLLEKTHQTRPIENEAATIPFQGREFQSVSYATKTFSPESESVRESVSKYSENQSGNFATIPSWPTDDQMRKRTPVLETSKEEKGGDSTSLKNWSRLHVIGQAHLTYIVAQSEDKMVFVDQHAAHERVAYERLMAAWKGGDIEVQRHLIPLSLDLEEEQVEALVSFRDELAKLGIEIDQGGPTSVLIRSSLPILKENSIVKALAKLAWEACDKGDSFAFEKAVSEVCATMACHSVIRAGQALSLEEMRALLLEMDEFPLSSFCPHGRPVFVEYPFDKLERDFGRIV